MRKLIVLSLILLLLALNCEAMAPVQLTGAGGKEVLTKIASTKITTQPTSASSSDLWSWGSIPLGNILSNGKLVSTGDDGSTVMVYPAFPGNTTPIYQISNPMVSKYAASDLQNPDLNQDYWTMAQLADQSVLF